MKFYILIPFFYEMTSPEKKKPELQDSFLVPLSYTGDTQWLKRRSL